jgi:hypothetical protein
MDTRQSLHALSSSLRDVLDSIVTFSPHTQKPPIIDASIDNLGGGGFSDDTPRQGSIRGLRRYKESVKRDLDVLEKVGASLSASTEHNTEEPAVSQ